MTSTDPRGVFALIDRELLGARGGVRPFLTVAVDRHTVRLSPVESRKALYGPGRDEALGRAVWRQAVREAQQEPGHGGDGTGRLLVVWLALPGLYRNLHRILRQLRVERDDLEGEAVLAVLATLDAADPDSPDMGGLMIKEAVNRMWAYANRIRQEVPVVDIAAFAEARNATAPPEEQLRPTDGWELHVTPPPCPNGLAATLRFAESRTRREGERLGALAHRAGLPDVVFRARRHEEADLIGTLVLRPAGARQ
ncbi:hypothetical protein IPZ58_34210 [Streptomyces roseoverticillatus]|uniref:hypothetical protein n=1 Tax=Streptomyces roseoverticillatus TaxID=66429 RepID=UPI001F175409|nr:hypothetical protein [Streptomyces roseoverticillatus]MCF3106583.1 hypothetical protein [Streptomyces roseoverticillatus]